jgi:hypothetical protein
MAMRHLGLGSTVITSGDHVEPLRLMFMREWVSSAGLLDCEGLVQERVLKFSFTVVSAPHRLELMTEELV